MRGQQGQSAVEFALVIPLFLLLIIGMIYGGFAYADYLQYSSAVRDVARDIAVEDTAQRRAIKDGLESNPPSEAVLKRYVDPLTKFYRVSFSVDPKDAAGNPVDMDNARMVTVGAKLALQVDVSILPSTLYTIQCTMPLEQDVGDNTNDDDD